MAKLYYKTYRTMIKAGDLTIEEAIADIEAHISPRWASAVIDMLTEEFGVVRD